MMVRRDKARYQRRKDGVLIFYSFNTDMVVECGEHLMSTTHYPLTDAHLNALKLFGYEIHDTLMPHDDEAIYIVQSAGSTRQLYLVASDSPEVWAAECAAHLAEGRKI